MTDAARLRLRDMRFFGRIGHTEEERVVGTHVEVDVELDLALADAPVHALEGTVDYRTLHAIVQEVVETGSHPLLEGLAAEVLDALEALDWQHAVVRVRKPDPPIKGTIGSAEVEVERVREPREDREL